MKIPEGKWEYSDLFRDALVAKDWGLTPLEFWNLDPLDRTIMIATTASSGAMASFESEISRKET